MNKKKKIKDEINVRLLNAKINILYDYLGIIEIEKDVFGGAVLYKKGMRTPRVAVWNVPKEIVEK